MGLSTSGRKKHHFRSWRLKRSEIHPILHQGWEISCSPEKNTDGAPAYCEKLQLTLQLYGKWQELILWPALIMVGIAPLGWIFGGENHRLCMGKVLNYSH